MGLMYLSCPLCLLCLVLDWLLVLMKCFLTSCGRDPVEQGIGLWFFASQSVFSLRCPPLLSRVCERGA